MVSHASSVRSAALDILSANASGLNFEAVSRRLQSLSDPRARRAMLRVFVAAPKWEAPVFLLEALRDPDEGVRASASRLIDRWIETFNRTHAKPTTMQLHRIAAVLDSVAARLPEETAKVLRFMIKPL